jgi:signal peptidase complex subunit 1
VYDVDVTSRPPHASNALAMDYAGQRLAERVAQVVMTAFTCAGFAYGYYAGSYRAMLTVFASGCAAATVASAPAWGVYRRHPVRWASAPTKTNR